MRDHPDIANAILGTMIFGNGCYESQLVVFGYPIAVYVDPDHGDLDNLLSVAGRAVIEFDSTLSMMRKYVADKYLPIKNERWLGDDELPISRHEFEARLIPRTLVAQQESELGLFFDVGEMFGGHEISVWIAPNGSCIDVQLCG